jgi:FtsH-binding integral membrane protein
MKQFIQQLLRDKLGSYSMREAVIGILLMVLIISWIAQQFFGKGVPEFMFYTFGSLIAAGCFGYTFEKKDQQQTTVPSEL